MSLAKRGFPTDDTKLTTTTSKPTSLNPNAAEFVPFSFRFSSGSSTADATPKSHAFGTFGNAVLDCSESSVSRNSDEEAHQYWRHQLPDDITPDFKVMAEDESQGLVKLSLSGLSFNDGGEASRFSSSMGIRHLLNEREELSPPHTIGNSFAEKLRCSVSPYGEDSVSLNSPHSPTIHWEKQIFSSDQILTNNRYAQPYNEDSRHEFVNSMMSEHALVDNTVEILASQFPGFAAESLAQVYFTNGCDLSLTIEMLTQLELQGHGSFNQNTNSKTLSAPNLSTLDCPAVPLSDNQNGVPKYSRDDLQQNFSPYQSFDKDNMMLFKTNSSVPSRYATDFDSVVKKAPQNSGVWKDDRNCSSHASIGSSGSSYVYNSTNGRGIHSANLQSGSAQAAPVWLETGDAVANMYSEMWEEALGHARPHNVYFERARQACLNGNKALAKELSMKGQLHNMCMKAAHGKAQESIDSQRNPVGLEVQANGKEQEKLIDLHGLHVGEAIHVLKHELGAIRSMARLAKQRLLVYVCVGTGHRTRGCSRTPARLPVAVQRYLLEEEGLSYTEPQPGLLLVVIY